MVELAHLFSWKSLAGGPHGTCFTFQCPLHSSTATGAMQDHGINVQIPFTRSLEYDCICDTSEISLSHMHSQPLLLNTNYFSI